ncbi:MAG: alpha/beta hydrolase, partial [Parvularculaceae bacterium]|nr:alpha/beta hydrolase [Parvularculaceae bacterium]
MEAISFYARDSYPLKGQIFKPDGEVKGGVLITAGTGYKARYYHSFAEALTKAGFTALTFDCRGIGESAPDNLASLSMRYWDWGKLDMPAALDNLAA